MGGKKACLENVPKETMIFAMETPREEDYEPSISATHEDTLVMPSVETPREPCIDKTMVETLEKPKQSWQLHEGRWRKASGYEKEILSRTSSTITVLSQAEECTDIEEKF